MIHTEIHIKGQLNPTWSDWFEGMQIMNDSSGGTMICGSLVDKSAVYGVLSRLSILGMTLISVACNEEHLTGPPFN